MASGKYSGTNPHNKTASELNRKKFIWRHSGPSVVQRYNWKQEWIAKGLDKKMSLVSYLKIKTSEWHKQKYLRKVKNKVPKPMDKTTKNNS